MILSINHLDGRCIAWSWFGAEWPNAVPVWTRNVIQLEFECHRDDIGYSEADEDVFTIRGIPVARITARDDS